jgi:hypothetical protein
VRLCDPLEYAIASRAPGNLSLNIENSLNRIRCIIHNRSFAHSCQSCIPRSNGEHCKNTSDGMKSSTKVFFGCIAFRASITLPSPLLSSAHSSFGHNLFCGRPAPVAAHAFHNQKTMVLMWQVRERCCGSLRSGLPSFRDGAHFVTSRAHSLPCLP